MERGAMKCGETFWNTRGEGAYPVTTDASVLKHGDQTGLETLVVHALNDADSLLVLDRSLKKVEVMIYTGGIAKALNLPLGEYGRKTEI